MNVWRGKLLEIIIILFITPFKALKLSGSVQLKYIKSYKHVHIKVTIQIQCDLKVSYIRWRFVL